MCCSKQCRGEGMLEQPPLPRGQPGSLALGASSPPGPHAPCAVGPLSCAQRLPVSDPEHMKHSSPCLPPQPQGRAPLAFAG